MVQHVTHKTKLLVYQWYQLSQQICFIVMHVHIGNSPLISSNSFLHKVVRNTLISPPQCWLWDHSISQTDWLSLLTYIGPSPWITIICSLYLRPFKYSHSCFIAKNYDPKLNDSMLVCFFGDQYTNSWFKYTTNTVVKRCDMVSEARSESSMACIMKPSPRGCGILGDSSSEPWTWTNSLVIQSLTLKSASLISGLVGSYINSALWYFLRWAKICSTWCRCPIQVNSKYKDTIDTSRQISTRPSSTIQRTITISDW